MKVGSLIRNQIQESGEQFLVLRFSFFVNQEPRTRNDERGTPKAEQRRSRRTNIV